MPAEEPKCNHAPLWRCDYCEKKEPKKQTLLEYMDKKIGYTGELLSKAAFERREVYRNISEYLEMKNN